jgi:putative transposase
MSAAPPTRPGGALERFRIIRPFLEGGVPLTAIAAAHAVSLRTLRRWVSGYRARGLPGLARKARTDQGHRRSLSPRLQQVIEGSALRKPRRTVASIHREVERICRREDWPLPSYSTVRRIIGALDPAMTTFAHAGVKAYQEAFELIYRHQAAAPNERWQADHSLLPMLVLNDAGKPEKPWLTVILDDYSRAVPGYFLGFAKPQGQRMKTRFGLCRGS